MSLDVIREAVIGTLLIAGGILSVSAGVGLLRFREVLSRMHSATKPQVLGLICILTAMAVKFPNWGTITSVMLVALFQMMTAPVSAHMVGRAAYRTKHMRGDLLYTDQLKRMIDQAERKKEAEREKERARAAEENGAD
ncbi:monovalent cation/H(+) antiporter subunit G [Saxibacter everestensis]|uniref:Monovalent cation/H(+) antiporter subunit G n=1 Tax=Saxibacter everestensis TaxID=2909229 RepID=A0ABY8QSS5_9MICO|nr:monovalent cation/H(+) antiporter subunit G [Brevibacteriaceae bacterium ZFBP1038]